MTDETPRKMMVRIEEGVWVDPMRVTCIRAVAVGTKGYVRVTLDNGDDFDACEHDCDLNDPDPSKVEGLMDRFMDAVNRR